ncbi:MAG: M1 family metallopeptidase [Cryomorphaceae bacterium]|nr:M1 family metallopeptidase [Cryomorphaceae bacterium]
MHRVILFLFATAFIACSTNPETTETPLPMDIHSHYQKSAARALHLNLHLKANFENHTLSGSAIWDIESNGDDEIYLDINGLEIHEIKDDRGNELPFLVGEADPILGEALVISGIKNAKQIVITYTTSPKAEAIQWMEPQGRSPFMFTQSQAILARTWIPCPDSPGWRFTYEATIEVPAHLMALMSAENPQTKTDDGIYSFQMKQQIPSYLMALAIGDVEFSAVSDRAGIYAEADVIEAATYEFAEVEEMIQAAEKLYGPYEWERYDILVLPASFPFGGMENPRLTFATPTIIAGDRSLTALVAHELAHSWSGNLVTNATWNDFWINEGFTVYFEHRIMEAVYGREYSEMLAALSLRDVQEEVEDFMPSRPNDTKLKLDLEGRNPDDGVSRIAYDKGYFFLRLIEETTGRARFDTFLKGYFAAHRFGVMTTEMFLDYLKENLLSAEEWAKIGVQEWVYETGLPENCPEVHATRFEKVDEVVNAFIASGALPDSNLTANWSTHEWLRFIYKYNDHSEKTTAQMKLLDENYGFTQSGNSEILAAWWQPVIATQYREAYPAMEKFLVDVGRRKFLTPTFRALKESDQLDVAREIYIKARPNYHAVSRQTMDELLR